MVIKAALDEEASRNSKQGIVLRHIWQNEDDPNEILFIFTAADLQKARKFIEANHSDAQ